MDKWKGLVDLVQSAIDKGAKSVEDVHKAVAKEPLDLLKNIEAFEKTADGLKEIQEHTIGTVYDTIRKVNNEVGDIAKDLLDKIDKERP